MQSRLSRLKATLQVDPQLLFQRLIVACNRSHDLQGLLRYELRNYSVALFDSFLTLRQPQKPVLADALWAKLSSNATSGPEGDAQHALDGGALLHRIPWPRGSTKMQPVRISVDYTAAMRLRRMETLSSCLMATTCLQRTRHTRRGQQGKPEQLSPSPGT